MAGLSHTLKITADLGKLQSAANRLQSNAPSADDIKKDPKAFLASIGVEIDDDTAAAITSRLSAPSTGAVAAAILHIDV